MMTTTAAATPPAMAAVGGSDEGTSSTAVEDVLGDAVVEDEDWPLVMVSEAVFTVVEERLWDADADDDCVVGCVIAATTTCKYCFQTLNSSLVYFIIVFPFQLTFFVAKKILLL